MARLMRERGWQWWQDGDSWEEVYAQADLLREVLGPSPFRPVEVAPRWLTPAVVALARGVYEERSFDHLPFLADALEEAGCNDAAILGHLRGPGPHARGCWGIDALTCRE